ncbi:EF-hand protein [Lophiotrema nucula]|uniref:Calmodulin n=1 Tax=Lophiotrema nucula TaxID=690887 RepID=A0A6A5Z1M2_9PLEO|nr:EF-hand protein [Lophiotrema nucula]
MKPPKRGRAAATKTGLISKRPSKLAKEHGLTADQEAEIREAFGLFAVQHPDHEDSKEGVLRKDDVRRCLISLNLTPDKSEVPSILETIDPLGTGFIPFIPFLSYASIALHTKEEGSDDNEDEEDEGYQQESNEEEVRAAYKLFTHGGAGPITLAHLRRVAKELREEVPDDVLRDMLREANGGVGKGRDAGSVGLEDFEQVMKRAGLTFG